MATVRDSAAIEIVEHVEGAVVAAPVWAVSPEPALRVGGAAGEAHDRFDGLVDVARLSDGRIVALDRGSGQLRFYDRWGGFLGAQGRPGAGPGEYERPVALWRLPGDSVAVFDVSTSRITIVDPAGAFARAVQVERRFGAGARPAGVLADGRLVVAEREYDLAGPGIRPQHMDLWAVGLGGEAPDSLLRTEWGRLGVVDEASRLVAGPLFGARTGVAVAGDRIVVGGGDGYEVKEYAPNGLLRRMVRWRGPDRAVKEGQPAAYIEAMLTGIEPEERPSRRAVLDSLPIPPERPAYDRVAADAWGHLWVREWAMPGFEAHRRWWVFDDQGRIAGTVAVPRAFTPLEFGPDYLLGRLVDADGVEYVALYTLERTGAG